MRSLRATVIRKSDNSGYYWILPNFAASAEIEAIDILRYGDAYFVPGQQTTIIQVGRQYGITPILTGRVNSVMQVPEANREGIAESAPAMAGCSAIGFWADQIKRLYRIGLVVEEGTFTIGVKLLGGAFSGSVVDLYVGSFISLAPTAFKVGDFVLIDDRYREPVVTGWWSPFGVTMIACGNAHTIAIVDGVLWGWGRSFTGELGVSSLGNVLNPMLIGIGIAQPTIVTTGYRRTFVIDDDGNLYGAGDNTEGALGTNKPTSDPTTFEFTQVPGSWLAVASGETHSIAIANDGSLWGWGNGRNLRLGSVLPNANRSPVPIDVGPDFIKVGCGFAFSFALKSNGDLYAFGRNDYGEFGDGTTSTGSAFALILSGVDDFVVGSYHTMVEQGGVWSVAGRNDYGQLGLGDLVNRTSWAVTANNFDSAFFGRFHSVGLATSAATSTGQNNLGQLGLGDTTDRDVFTGIAGDFSLLPVGYCYDFVVAQGTDGKLYGWGSNGSGELGTGVSGPPKTSPTEVIFL